VEWIKVFPDHLGVKVVADRPSMSCNPRLAARCRRLWVSEGRRARSGASMFGLVFREQSGVVAGFKEIDSNAGDSEANLKLSIATYLVAMAVVVSSLAGITLGMSRVRSRALNDAQVPPGWSESGGLRSQIHRGVRSSADGGWKPPFKRIWFGFLIIDLIAIIIVIAS
jgi:hypothetical protein